MEYLPSTPGIEIGFSHKESETCILEPSRTFVSMGLSHLMGSSEQGIKHRPGALLYSDIARNNSRTSNGPSGHLQGVDMPCCLKTRGWVPYSHF